MCVFVCLVLAVFPLFGFGTTISCSNPEYAGKTLTFYTPTDPITNHPEKLFVLKFDALGKAKTDISIEGTVYTYADFGIYRGLLILEARKTHELKLPPFRKKSFADSKNPYFQPVSFWFLTEAGNMLTDKVSGYEELLNQLTDKYFDSLYFRQSQTAFDSLKLELNQKFPKNEPTAFAYHKKMQLKVIEADAFRLTPQKYASLFEVASGYWTHVGFSTLFNKAFSNQMNFLVSGKAGKELSTLVAEKNISGLLKLISTQYNLSGKVSELTLLKLLYDSYYSSYFSKDAVKNMISSDFFMKNSNSVIRKAAKNIISKYTFMEEGSVAPVICLKNLTGKQVCSNSNTDKCKYVVFADEEMVVCQEHLKYLTRINQLFNKNLEIFVILRNTNRVKIDKFFSENKIPGTIVVDTDGEYIEKYKVRSFPRCVLLDEKHQIIQKNAKAPLDGFEQYFGNWLRKELFLRQRNQSK